MRERNVGDGAVMGVVNASIDCQPTGPRGGASCTERKRSRLVGLG